MRTIFDTIAFAIWLWLFCEFLERWSERMIEVKFTCDYCKKEFDLPIRKTWHDFNYRGQEHILGIAANSVFGDFHKIDYLDVCDKCYEEYKLLTHEAEMEVFEKFKKGRKNDATN